MVATSGFIVVRTGTERLIWPEKGSVHACVWSIVRSHAFFLFSGQTLARLPLIDQERLEPRLEGDPQTRLRGAVGVCSGLRRVGPEGRVLYGSIGAGGREGLGMSLNEGGSGWGDASNQCQEQ